MKKINNYFPHDFNARNDIKLKKVNMELGLGGIGLYWCIIEYLYENNGYLTLDEDVDLLSFELRIDKGSIINLIEKYDLFKKIKNKFYSPSVLTRLRVINEKSNINRENALKRWKKNNANAMRPHSEINTNGLQTQCHIKENKRKENKRNNNYITTTDNTIYSFIEENFGRTLSGVEFEKINIWLSEFNVEILKYAINIAVMNQKKTFAYVDGILKNWKGKGFKTIEEVKIDNINGSILKKSNNSNSEVELFDYNWLEDNG